jgi:hypothetical protein
VNTIVLPDSFLVIYQDSLDFFSIFPDVKIHAGPLGFGLSADNDIVRLRTEWGLLVDSVQYSSVAPWPVIPEGSGATLELIDPERDNEDPQSWQISQVQGTPGRTNSDGRITAVEAEEQVQIYQFVLFQNYPNPFNPVTTINYQVPNQTHIEISIYNLSGKKVCSLLEENKSVGHYQVQWEGKDDSGEQVASGIYLCTMKADQYVQTIRMLLLR